MSTEPTSLGTRRASSRNARRDGSAAACRSRPVFDRITLTGTDTTSLGGFVVLEWRTKMRKSPLMIRPTQVLLASSALVFIACGGKATYSAPVGLNLNARSGDVRSGNLSRDEAIAAEPG